LSRGRRPSTEQRSPAPEHIDGAVTRRSLVRTVLHAGVVLAAVIGGAFGVQAALLPSPSHEELLAVDALKNLARYQAMSSTEQIGTRTMQSFCLEDQVYYAKTNSFVPAQFVLIGRRERYYGFGHGIRALGPQPSYQKARERFLLAGCPQFLAKRLGTLLSDWRIVHFTSVRTDGVSAYRIHFGRVDSGIDLYVDRRDLHPLALGLGPGSSSHSDIEPSLGTAHDELIDHILPSALRKRFRIE
jgi:hypothetical protein